VSQASKLLGVTSGGGGVTGCGAELEEELPHLFRIS